MQLKDGEESEVNRVTFTVGLNARLRVLMVQNVQGGGGGGVLHIPCRLRVALCSGGPCVSPVRNDIGHGMVDVLPVNVALLCDTSIIIATFMHPSTHSWFHIAFTPGTLLSTMPFLSLGFWEQLGK